MREFYTNSNEIHDLLKQICDLDVSPLENVGDPLTTTVFLFNVLVYCKPDGP